jgi:hypothetical protein
VRRGAFRSSVIAGIVGTDIVGTEHGRNVERRYEPVTIGENEGSRYNTVVISARDLNERRLQWFDIG